MKLFEKVPLAAATHAVIARFHKLPHKPLHVVHHVAHMSYLGAVSVEAHGLYSYCAAGLLVVVVVNLLAGEGVAE